MYTGDLPLKIIMNYGQIKLYDTSCNVLFHIYLLITKTTKFGIRQSEIYGNSPSLGAHYTPVKRPFCT